VIVINGKNICRSAGLSETLEIIFRIKKGDLLGNTSNSKSQHRLQDVDWLKTLRVKYICDLMVEDTVKILGLSLCSSERREKTHQTFHLSAMPYPGVDSYEGIVEKTFPSKNPKWTTQFWQRIQTSLSLCKECSLPTPYKWSQYRSWNIVELTQNYLRFLFFLLHDPEPDSGLLIHCISGNRIHQNQRHVTGGCILLTSSLLDY